MQFDNNCDFFSKLLLDFVQYDLFDGYLNYRLPELVLISKCFQKINNQSVYIKPVFPEISDIIFMIGMINELLEFKETIQFRINEIKKTLGKDPFDFYLENHENIIIQRFLHGTWTTIGLAYLLKNMRCPFFCLFYYGIRRIKNNHGLLCAAVEVEDMELIHMLAPHYPTFFDFMKDCVGDHIQFTKLTSPERSDFGRVFNKMAYQYRPIQGVPERTISLIYCVLCDDVEKFKEFGKFIDLSNEEKLIDFICDQGAVRIYEFLKSNESYLVREKFVSVKLTTHKYIYYDLI